MLVHVDRLSISMSAYNYSKLGGLLNVGISRQIKEDKLFEKCPKVRQKHDKYK